MRWRWYDEQSLQSAGYVRQEDRGVAGAREGYRVHDGKKKGRIPFPCGYTGRQARRRSSCCGAPKDDEYDDYGEDAFKYEGEERPTAAICRDRGRRFDYNPTASHGANGGSVAELAISRRFERGPAIGSSSLYLGALE